jgi:hypothetical protein
MVVPGASSSGCSVPPCCACMTRCARHDGSCHWCRQSHCSATHRVAAIHVSLVQRSGCLRSCTHGGELDTNTKPSKCVRRARLQTHAPCVAACAPASHPLRLAHRTTSPRATRQRALLLPLRPVACPPSPPPQQWRCCLAPLQQRRARVAVLNRRRRAARPRPPRPLPPRLRAPHTPPPLRWDCRPALVDPHPPCTPLSFRLPASLARSRRGASRRFSRAQRPQPAGRAPPPAVEGGASSLCAPPNPSAPTRLRSPVRNAPSLLSPDCPGSVTTLRQPAERPARTFGG